MTNPPSYRSTYSGLNKYICPEEYACFMTSHLEKYQKFDLLMKMILHNRKHCTFSFFSIFLAFLRKSRMFYSCISSCLFFKFEYVDHNGSILVHIHKLLKIKKRNTLFNSNLSQKHKNNFLIPPDQYQIET